MLCLMRAKRRVMPLLSNILKTCQKKAIIIAAGLTSARIGMVSYGVESELGQLETTVHKVVSGSKVAFDARSDLYEETTSRERFKSDNFRELELDFAVGMTVRKAASRLNRVRREIAGIIPTTLRNNVEREGMAVCSQKEALAERVLLANGFTVDAELTQPENFVSNEPIASFKIILDWYHLSKKCRE